MVLLNPIPLNVINNINILKTNFGLTAYKYTIYKVNYSDKIIAFLEKEKPEKAHLVITILWLNEYDPNPYHQINFVKFYHVKSICSMECLLIEQLDINNFEIRTPSSINRYIYNLKTNLFKQYEILPGRIYEMETNSKTEMVYYNIPII